MGATGPAGLILAGGRGRRLGTDKTRLPLGRRTMLEHVLRALGTLCRPILIAGRSPATAVDPGIRWVADRRPGRGPLAGLEAGLAGAPEGWVAVAACDQPFLRPALLELLWAAARSAAAGAVIPLLDGRPQPFPAVYHTSLAPVVSRLLDSGPAPVQAVLDQVAVVYVSEGQIRSADPQLLSFHNVNTPEAYRQALALIGAGEVMPV